MCGALPPCLPRSLKRRTPPRRRRTAGQVCAACHAADGNSIAPTNPKIAGQFPEYLHKQLADFKAQRRKKPARENPIMTGDGRQPVRRRHEGPRGLLRRAEAQAAPRRSDKNLAAARTAPLARRQYREWRSGLRPVATAPQGRGIPAQYPRVAGQYAEYIAAQLKAFKEDGRANDANGIMRGVAARMTEREIQRGSGVCGGAALAEIIGRSPVLADRSPGNPLRRTS